MTTKVEDHIPLMCQLRRAATLPPVEQNGMIAAIVFSMQSRTQFDFASMETVHENILHKVCNSSIFKCDVLAIALLRIKILPSFLPSFH